MGSYCRYRIFFILLIATQGVYGQQPQAQMPPSRPDEPATLSVEKIMQDSKWIGASPSDPYWSADGKMLFFHWNPERAVSDPLYYITREDPKPRKADYALWHSHPSANIVRYNTARDAYTFSRDGDIFFVSAKNGLEKRVTATVDIESNPSFSFNDRRIVYSKAGNLFSWEIGTGETRQLTNFQPGAAPAANAPLNAQEKWLQDDQLQHFDVLRDRREKKELADSTAKANKPKELKPIYRDGRELTGITISPDGRFIAYSLLQAAPGARITQVHSFVTESGFTRDIPSRTKVGAPQGIYRCYIFDAEKDTVTTLETGGLPGIGDVPDYVKKPVSPMPENALSENALSKNALSDDGKQKAPAGPLPREVFVNGPYWSEKGEHAVVDIRSLDHKDRWILSLDAASGSMKLLDRQRDEAWIAGPGIGDGEDSNSGRVGWINEEIIWYQSEASGYAHLYTSNVTTGEKTQLTHGNYEVIDAVLSTDKKYFYITTNETDPGEQQFYRLSVQGGKAERITTMEGANQVVVSPDEQQAAILNSYSNRPWELYVQGLQSPGSKGNGVGAGGSGSGQALRITDQAMSAAFRAYPWRDPEIIRFKARDGAMVRARIYRPRNGPASAISVKPGVIFVHGAGYLQNVHKWWSHYFREYMFNNLLADNGYTVLDIDYRGSAGYGRDWRTGIYRHMGGKDLSDQVDGARWLVEHEGVDPKRMGIYGGSYGGFITLMAMFTEPHTFAAGAALRSVTDWAHYNHGYTSSILNEPYNDTLAYRQSSPLYFAEGLQGHLLMCHGMVDENVHFQDIVRLTQRLIELGKNNWELAVYPMEDHTFTEPSSWTDEYKRIYKLFNDWLKAPNP